MNSIKIDAYQVNKLSLDMNAYYQFRKGYFIRARQLFGQAGMALSLDKQPEFEFINENDEKDDEIRKELNRGIIIKKRSYEESSIMMCADIVANLTDAAISRVERDQNWLIYQNNGNFLGMWSIIKKCWMIPEESKITIQIQFQHELKQLKQSDSLEEYCINFSNIIEKLKSVDDPTPEIMNVRTFILGLNNNMKKFALKYMKNKDLQQKLDTFDKVQEEALQYWRTNTYAESALGDLSAEVKLNQNQDEQAYMFQQPRKKQKINRIPPDEWKELNDKQKSIIIKRRNESDNKYSNSSATPCGYCNKTNHKTKNCIFLNKKLKDNDDIDHKTKVNTESDYPKIYIFHSYSENKTYLDTAAAVNVFNTKSSLSKFRPVNITISGLGGNVNCTEEGYHPVFGWGYILLNATCSLISWKTVKKKCTLKYKRKIDTFIMYTRDYIVSFPVVANGFYALSEIKKINDDGDTPKAVVNMITNHKKTTTSESNNSKIKSNLIKNKPNKYGKPTKNSKHVLAIDEPKTTSKNENPTSNPNKINQTNKIVDVNNDGKNKIPISHGEDRTRPNKNETQRINDIIKLHTMMGHIGNAALSTALDNGIIIGTYLTSKDVRLYEKFGPYCHACEKGKATQDISYPSVEPLPSKIGETVHTDIIFIKINKKRNQPYLFSVDAYSAFVMIKKLKSKHAIDVLNGIKKNICFILEMWISNQHLENRQ